MKNIAIKSAVINANGAKSPAVSAYQRQAINKAAQEIKKLEEDISALENN